MYLGIVGSSTALLLQIADTNSLFDISNILGDAPAGSYAPESAFIDDSQFLCLVLSSSSPFTRAASAQTLLRLNSR